VVVVVREGRGLDLAAVQEEEVEVEQQGEMVGGERMHLGERIHAWLGTGAGVGGKGGWRAGGLGEGGGKGGGC
jgi:hypothetical protein